MNIAKRAIAFALASVFTFGTLAFAAEDGNSVTITQRDSYIDENGNGNLRFVSEVILEAGKKIAKFGTWIVPQYYLDKGQELRGDATVDFNGNINNLDYTDKDGKRTAQFTADIMGIPAQLIGEEFYAKSYIEYEADEEGATPVPVVSSLASSSAEVRKFEKEEENYTPTYYTPAPTAEPTPTPTPEPTPTPTPEPVAKFDARLVNHDKYLYRVGNGNAVSLGTLFKAQKDENENDLEIDDSAVDVTVTPKNSEIATAALETYAKNESDWTKSTLKFTGEGPVEVMIKETETGEPYTLNLEVVPGTNFTEGATLSGSKNIVLLGDVNLGNSDKQNSALYLNGNKLYGNGFEIDASGQGISSQAYGIIGLYNSEIDNAVIIGPTYSDYPAKAKTDYYASVICAYDGNSAISNSHISGAAAPVRSRSNININNCVLSNGYVAGIIVLGGNVTTTDVTTIGNNSLGIVADMDAPASAKLTINGDLTQHNFVAENAKGLSTYANTLKDKMFESGYSKYQFSSGGTKYVNTGIVSLSSDFGKDNIIDNRADKKYYSGMPASISLGIFGTFSGYVYTMENTDPSMLETSYTEPDYEPTVQKPYAPVFSWSIPAGSEVPAGGDSHFYKDSSGVLQIQFLTGKSKELDMSTLPKFVKYGKTAIDHDSIACVKDSTGAKLQETDGKVTFTEAGEYTITYSYTDNNVYGCDGELTDAVNYDKTIKVNVAVKKQAPNAVITVTSNTGTMYYGNSGWDDYKPAVPIFDGMTIVDYDDNGNQYTVLDGSKQETFLKNIASVVADSDNKTGFTIKFPDGCKLVIKCGAPYKSGTLVFKTYNNKFLMCGSADYNYNTQDANWTVLSYTYTGRNGVAVTYDPDRTFSVTSGTNGINLSSLSTNKFLMYDAQGGTVSPAYTGTSPATLPTPTRDGYTFLNWNTKTDGTGTSYNAGATITFNSSLTLYAIWAKNVEVSFSSDGEVVDTISAGAGTSQTLPTRSAFADWLEGWYTAEDGGEKIGNGGASFIVPAEDTTYYAHWSPKYAVAYNANGGTVSPEAAVYEGTALTLPAPTNGSKTFEGWFTAAEGGTKIGTAGDSYTPTADIELFAQWSDNILVTFDGNGGTAGTNSDTYDRVTPITLPSAIWAGHQFNGWYTEATGGAKVGDAGESYAPTENTTLHAQWTAYTVTYDGNGATNPASDSAGADGTVTLATPTRTGYTFNGWYTAASGGTKIGNGGASYTPTADITLHAQWTINSYKVTIKTSNSSTDVTVNGTSVSNGGSVAYNSVVKVVLSYTQTDSLTFTIKQGSTDVTYYSDEACTSSTTNTAAGTYYFKMPAGEVTISSSSKSCVAEGTMITLADGTQKAVENLKGDEKLLVWNLETGRYEEAPIVFVDSDDKAEFEVIKLNFSDGTYVDVISEHGFFDIDLGEYVYLDADADQYIGHRFVKYNDKARNTWTIVTLTSVTKENKVTRAYSPVTSKHLCYYVNDMLSMPGGINGLFNIFKVNTDTMTYDKAQMAADIKNYGLFTYDDFKALIPVEVFEVFNGQYLKIAMAKGMLTWDDIAYLAERYTPLAMGE